jgi:tetratricopeptide (TPR) repeat protein
MVIPHFYIASLAKAPEFASLPGKSGRFCALVSFSFHALPRKRCYMEVAVIAPASFRRSLVLRSLRGAGCLAIVLCGLLTAGTGCSNSDLVTFADEHRQQGIKLYNAGEYPDAAGAFTSAIKQRPQDYQSYYYLGRTYEAMHNYHQAVKEYKTSLLIMANSLAGQEDMAFRNKVLDGLASAVAANNSIDLEARAFSSPAGAKSAEDHFVLAKVRRLQKDADSALDEYAKAATGDPKNLAIAKEHGLYLLQLNQRTRAAGELRRAYVLNRRQRNPDDDEVNAALRKAGVTPGPSLADEGDLAQPLIPTGPLPEVDFSKMGNGGSDRQASTNEK